MAEMDKKSPDVFTEYRDFTSPDWLRIKPIVEQLFNGSIPGELELHLTEWAVIRGQGHRGQISRDRMNQITRAFSDSHNEMFDNKLFSGAMGMISAKFPLAA